MHKIFILLLITVLVFSCKKENHLSLDAQKSNSTIQLNKNKLLKHIAYLSSDSLEGRKVSTRGNALARDYIIDELKMSGLPINVQEFQLSNKKQTGINIITEVKGSEDSKKIIVITAHYDHVGIRDNTETKNDSIDVIYNGADDNASGTSALLEMAIYFAKNKPKHNIILVATDAEESGLQGASYFVDNYEQLDQIVLNINMDMISVSHTNQLNVCGTIHTESLANFFSNRSTNDNLKITFDHNGTDGKQDWTKSSDHYPFHKADIPFLYFGVEDHDQYHQVGDEFENIDKAFYVNASNYILNTIVDLDEVLK